jgi:O-antigen ligase
VRRDSAPSAAFGSDQLRRVSISRSYPSSIGQTERGSGNWRSLNTALAVAVFIVVALAPLPLGSNRPVFWSFWGVVLGALSIIHGSLSAVSGTRLRAPLRGYLPETGLYGVLLLATVVQAVKFGELLPPAIGYLPQLDRALPTISVDPGSTWLSLIQWVSFGLLFVLTVQFSVNEGRARRFMFGLFLVIAGYATNGLVSLQLGDTLLGFEKLSYLGFATGTFINRNSFATFLACGLAIGVSFLMDLVGRRRDHTLNHRLGMWATLLMALALQAAALFATGSRMGLVSAAVGVSAVFLVAIVGERRNAAAALLLVLAGVAAAATLLFVFGEPLLERLVFLQTEGGGRSELHAQVWHAILQRPLTGYGGGSFASVAGLVVGPPLSGAVVWEYTHSTYLALWFEYGLVVGSLPLLICLIIAIRLLSNLFRGHRKVISRAAIGTLAVFACHSLLDFSAEIEANAFLLTATLGLAVASSQRPKPSPETETPAY